MVAANTRTKQSAWSEVVRAARRITEVERLATTGSELGPSIIKHAAAPLVTILRDACNNYLEVSNGSKRD